MVQKSYGVVLLPLHASLPSKIQPETCAGRSISQRGFGSALLCPLGHRQGATSQDRPKTQAHMMQLLSRILPLERYTVT
jgi:hypothetical protein